MPDDNATAEVAALKSGLGPFYGRILAALERIGDNTDPRQLSLALDDRPPKRPTRKSEAEDA